MNTLVEIKIRFDYDKLAEHNLEVKWMKGRVHSIETFGTVDGPGIRFVLFLQGCPLRCLYCHNPDTWAFEEGQDRDSDELIQEVLKYKSYLRNGGVTVSGGEPLAQIEFVIDFFTKLKALGIHTCIDTSGYYFSELTKKQYDRLLAVTDLFLLDIKHIDDEKHLKLTSVSNKNPLAFARYLSEKKIPVWIRHVLVPGYSDDVNDLKALRKFIDTLENVEKVEILPYHTMGVNKYQQMNKIYPLDGVLPPSAELVSLAREIVEGQHA